MKNPNHISQETVMSLIRSARSAFFVLTLLALVPSIAIAQARLEREGVVLYWGLVPAAIVSQKHALEDMHGVVPKDSVKLPSRPAEIEFAVSAWSPHRETR